MISWFEMLLVLLFVWFMFYGFIVGLGFGVFCLLLRWVGFGFAFCVFGLLCILVLRGLQLLCCLGGLVYCFVLVVVYGCGVYCVWWI